MTPPRIAAVIFDCDGVLVDSETASFDLISEDLASYGLVMPRAELELTFLGGTMKNVWETARRLGAALPDDWVADFYERLYQRLAQGIDLIDGVMEVIEALDAAGIPYAVGSNGSDHKMQVTLGQHPLLMRRLEGRLFSGQTLGCPKPDPGLFLHAAKFLGIDPAACAVIDDSVPGCQAAMRAGMQGYGFAEHDDGVRLAETGVRVFHKMAEFPGLIGLR